MDYRNECKHFINYADFLALRMRLNALLPRDPHAGPEGDYFVRSLYFDDLEDTALLEKINGVNAREKFRIRYYNHDPSRICLEKKSKRSGLSAKRACDVAKEDVLRILAGDIDWMAASKESLLVEFYTKLRCGLLPRAVVDYTRYAYCYLAGNVRVTLDCDIRTGMEPLRFLEADCLSAPLPENTALLEVKWDEFLPAFIRDAVQLGARRTEAFSKYAACRVYG